MMINVRPPPVVLLLGTGAAGRSLLPLSHLTAFGYKIADHRHESDGVGTARTMQPDVVLVDVAESHAKGLELCRGLQANPDTRAIPLIAITGNPSIGQFMMTLRVAACDTVSLRAEIDRLLNEKTPPLQ